MRALDDMSESFSKSSKKLILVDGYGFVFRAYHALARANMKRSDGTPVGAVYAFTNMLIKTIKDHEADYIAVVFGKVKSPEFKIESYMGRDKNDRTKMTTVDPVNPKIAITYGKVVEYIDNEYTIVKVKIETGRTHQIRVHLASIGYPIL